MMNEEGEMDEELRVVLDALLSGQDELRSGLARVSTAVDTLENGQTDLKLSMVTLSAEMQDLHSDVLGQRTTMMDRFERVENKLTTLQEDVSVNMMTVLRQNDVRDAERTDVTNLARIVLKMEQQILRLRTEMDELKKAS